MNYYRKFDISNSSIYEHISYLSLFVNSIIFKKALERFCKVCAQLPIPNKVNNDWGQYYKTVINFIKNVYYVENNGTTHNVFDKLNKIYDIYYTNNQYQRQHAFSMSDFNKFCVNNNISQIQQYISNTFTSPSINNNFMKALYDNLFNVIKYHEITKLAFTPLFTTLRKLDFMATFLDILLQWVQLTTYRDDIKGLEQPYFNDIPVLPFDSI